LTGSITGGTKRYELLIAAVLVVVILLYVGYYEALEDVDIETIVFIKKHLTFQMKLYNIHANDEEIREVCA